VFIIVFRGFWILLHPWFFPLLAAFTIGLIGTDVVPGILLVLLIGVQLICGYRNYWLGWGSFAASIGLIELMS
jgi:hypothetical protein